MVLIGPADPEQFRQTIKGARHYVDPLPGDHIAEATDAYFASVSSIKSVADPFAFGNYSLAARLVSALVENPKRLDGLPPDELRAAILTIDSLGLKRAGTRGTNVHTIADALLTGRIPLMPPDSPGAEYREALEDFVNTYEPELIYSEVPLFNRTLHGRGYGGTLDAIVRIDGKLYLLDWKSRAEGTEHTAYGGEAAQIGAYANAEYLVIAGADGNPVRVHPPKLDGGIIVSVKESGCVVFPVDLDAGFALFTAMHQWVPIKKSERQTIGRRWAPRRGKSVAQVSGQTEPASPMPAASIPVPLGFAHGLTESSTTVEPVCELSKAAQVARLGENPAEGPQVNAGDVAALRGKYERLSDDARAWLNALAEQAAQTGHPFHMSRIHTVRRFEIMRGLVTLAEVIHAQHDSGDTVRLILAAELGEVAHYPALTPGQILGSLDCAGAKVFAEHVDAFIFGIVGATVTDDGAVSLQFGAA